MRGSFCLWLRGAAGLQSCVGLAAAGAGLGRCVWCEIVWFLQLWWVAWLWYCYLDRRFDSWPLLFVYVTMMAEFAVPQLLRFRHIDLPQAPSKWALYYRMNSQSEDFAGEHSESNPRSYSRVCGHANSSSWHAAESCFVIGLAAFEWSHPCLTSWHFEPWIMVDFWCRCRQSFSSNYCCCVWCWNSSCSFDICCWREHCDCQITALGEESGRLGCFEWMVLNACVDSNCFDFGPVQHLNKAYFAPFLTSLPSPGVFQLFVRSSSPSCPILSGTSTFYEHYQPSHFTLEPQYSQFYAATGIILDETTTNSSFSLYSAISTTYSHSSAVFDWFALFSSINIFLQYWVGARNWCRIVVWGCMIGCYMIDFFYCSSSWPNSFHLVSKLHFYSNHHFASSSMDFPEQHYFLVSRSGQLSRRDVAYYN